MITVKKEIIIQERHYFQLDKILNYWRNELGYFNLTYSELINYLINKEFWELMQDKKFRHCSPIGEFDNE